MAACGSSSSDRSNDLGNAFTHCGSLTDTHLQYDFHTLTVNVPASDPSKLQCVITDLKISDGIVQRMDATKALDGQQSATENGLNIAWSVSVDSNGDQQIFAQFSPA
jgi:hypothetical protein